MFKAMAPGMPLIAPNDGSIPKVITYGETGWFVDAVGDDASGAQTLVDELWAIEWNASVLSRVGQAARVVLRELHSDNAMLRRLSEVFIQPVKYSLAQRG